MSETITVVGNVGSIPEQRQVAPGVHVTGFTLASTQRRFDKERGEWIDAHTNWYDVSVFRGLGENAFRSIHKGERVIVTGRLRLRSWETDSSRGVSAELTADALGHDLQWGTSEFRKRDAARPRTTDAASPEATDAAVAPPPRAETDPLAAWGAPAASPEAEPAETPF